MMREDLVKRRIRNRYIFLLTAIPLLASCSNGGNDSVDSDQVAQSGNDFEYISVSDGEIQTLHELRYRVSMGEKFKVAGPKNRVDHFNNVPYRISLAALTSDDRSLTIHAEVVADLSGASNYNHLPPVDWPNNSFRSDGPACLEIPADEVEDEHDLLFLRENGFEPSGSILYAQYFVTTADMNSEVVITLLQRVPSCDDAVASAAMIRDFQARASVIKIE